MRWAQFGTFPKEMTNTRSAEIFIQQLFISAYIDCWRKSFRVFNKVVTLSDSHADNFIRNEVTARIEFDVYKMPRIVKRLLTHKLKK